MIDDYQDENNNINQIQNNLEDAISEPELTSIESKDPSLYNDYKILYNKEVPLDLIYEDREEPDNIVSSALIRFKLLYKAKSTEEFPLNVKLELSWENDIFFLYTNFVDINIFAEIKRNQKFNIDFTQYCKLIERLCDNCIKDPDAYFGEFIIQNDGVSKLQFIKITPFKDLELLNLEFKKVSDKIIEKHILYRFGYIKSKLEYNKKVMKVAGDVINECNPEIIQPFLERNDNYNLNIKKFFGNNA